GVLSGKEGPAVARVADAARRHPRAAPSLFRVSMEEPMNRKRVGIALAALFGASAFATPSLAQNEQFIPQLVYRTGAYAPNGVPVANGIADYYKLINERDGGINGVKIVFEECDTGYAPTAAWSATSG